MISTRLFAIAALVAGVAAQNQKGCVPDGQFDANGSVDYFPEKSNLASVNANSNIQISYHNYYKIVKTTLPTANQTIVLWQCGTQRPSNVTADKFIAVPVDSVAIADTTTVPYIEALGGRSSITFSSAGQYTGSPCLQALNSTQTLNTTEITAQIATVDAFFSFSDPTVANATNFVAFAATSDPGALRRAEWIHFMAAFYNAEAQGNKIYKDIADNYNCLSSAAQQSAPSTPLNVAFTSYSNYQGKSTWSVSAARYVNDYITSIGAKNLTLTNTTFADSTSFLNAIKPADIIVDVSLGLLTQGALLKAYGLTKDSDYKFIKNNKIFSVNKEVNLNGGTSWFESAVLEQNVVLADLIWAAYPNVQPNYQSTYIKNIVDTANVTLSASQCTDRNAPATVPTLACPTPVKQTNGGSSGAGSGAGSVVASSFGAIAALVGAAAFLL